MTEQQPDEMQKLAEAREAVERGEVPDRFDLSHKAMVMRSIIRAQQTEQAEHPSNNE